MNGGKLTVMALLRAQPGKEEEVKRGLLALTDTDSRFKMRALRWALLGGLRSAVRLCRS